MLGKMNRFMSDLPGIWFVLLIVIWTFLIAMPLDWFLPEVQKNPLMQGPIILQFLVGIIFAPIFETLVFQVLLFWILSYIPFIRNHDYLIILIASIIFGLNHQFGITYIIGTSLIGLLYNYAYWVYQKKNEKVKSTISAFWIVFWIHLLHNAISITVSNL
ncbi:CPBP family glutamic-type intramembrane protease [Bacillus paranthracis]|uniref:CPBP family glutamic-type intramembrane protease n=1 Tax=Bacillus paranthracis TaxID=2026186 RepID=UPI003303ADEC|nr:CPBP family intramembrane metalloprotease [Bacillus cereus]HDR8090374.1 CPBP family intramembrane metalloprotease [Bacillus cereus]